MTEVMKVVHTLIRTRASSRVYDPDRPVPPEMLTALLEAARWAPSSGNGQPWRYLVFDDRVPAAREDARSCLVPDNAVWAGRAPVLLLAIAREIRAGGKTNRYAKHDLGLANQNILLQAVAMGLCCRPMGGFNNEKAARLFRIPAGHLPMVMIALGFPGSPEDVGEAVREKEAQARTRRPVDEFAFLGAWGKCFLDNDA